MFFIIQALFTLLGHYYLSALSLMTLTGTSTFLSACLLIENDTHTVENGLDYSDYNVLKLF
jgi:hypothetical protein